MKILLTGSAGFIAGYLVEDLLAAGHEVVGLDNYSKYGRTKKSYQNHPAYRFVEGDAKDAELLKRLAAECDHFVACAARIGGIAYFHRYAYDLIAENERIAAASFDAAIDAHRRGKLRKITVLSSSMVFENATVFPTPESHLRECPPPTSTYGFQKLACEYFARGAWEQYQLPYTIARPFNCVGIGERRALGDADIPSGNVKLAMSHVVPDLVQKVLKGQDPLHVLGDGNQIRCYTYGGDLSRGIMAAMFHPAAENEDFNLSTPTATSVLELAKLIWRKVHGPDPGIIRCTPNSATLLPTGEECCSSGRVAYKPFRWVSDPPFPYDVQMRQPEVSKARRVLGYEAATSLDEMLDEVIPWVREEIAHSRI